MAHPGFHGSPKDPKYHVAPSSFAPDASKAVSPTATAPTTSSKSKSKPAAPLSSLPAESSTPLFISGEPDVPQPAPSSPRKSSPASDPPAHAGQLLTAARARRILQAHTGLCVPRSTFYRWLSNGTILTVRLMNSVRVPTEALAAFLALRTETQPNPFSDLPPHQREAAQEHNRALLEIIHAHIAENNSTLPPAEP